MKTALDYSCEHKAPQRDYGAPLDNLKGVYPDDVYGPNAARYYGVASGDATDKAAVRIIQSTKGKPDAPVKVFRAIPKGIQSNEINRGDWITTMKSYAVMHGEGALGGDYKILEKTVNAGDLYTNGDSIFEFGYDPKFMPSDADYLSAVKQGDTKAAQQMVDAAAKAAGYTIGPVWHSTGKGNFDVFTQQPIGFTGAGGSFGHFGSLQQANKLFKNTTEFAEWANTQPKVTEENRIKPSLRKFYLNASKLKRVEDDIDGPMWGLLADKARRQGYDALVYSNKVEGKGDSYVPLSNPNQIKLADPITYDKSGKVIPLSQRFDSGREEITNPAGRIPAQFPYEYASYLKQHFPEIWRLGGNIRGNDAFRWWTAYRQGDRSPTVTHWWSVTRPAWIARHYRDHLIAGVVAQIKWGTIGRLGVTGMKRVVETKIRNSR